MWISKHYKEQGGTYLGKQIKAEPPKGEAKGRVGDWIDEKWIQVEPYLTNGEKILCGEKTDMMKKACRPTKHISYKTPMLLDELVKKYGKDAILKLARLKNRDMKGRVMWQANKFIPSK
jgi:hypothetical protein